MSIVFVAGPLSGLFVQPLIGVLADSSTSRFGRRRPYMLVGAIICALAMLLLGFTKDIASWFLDRDSSANANLTIWLAVLAIYCIDFSINAGKPEPPSLPIYLTDDSQYKPRTVHSSSIHSQQHSKNAETPGLAECSVSAVSLDSSCMSVVVTLLSDTDAT